MIIFKQKIEVILKIIAFSRKTRYLFAIFPLKAVENLQKKVDFFYPGPFWPPFFPTFRVPLDFGFWPPKICVFVFFTLFFVPFNPFAVTPRGVRFEKIANFDKNRQKWAQKYPKMAKMTIFRPKFPKLGHFCPHFGPELKKYKFYDPFLAYFWTKTFESEWISSFRHFFPKVSKNRQKRAKKALLARGFFYSDFFSPYFSGSSGVFLTSKRQTDSS